MLPARLWIKRCGIAAQSRKKSVNIMKTNADQP
jgi:hypothetical protein